MTPEPISDERLAEIEKRAEDATHGPWGWSCGMDSRAIVIASDPTFDVRVDGHADAEFIAHARTDVPDLVAEVVQLRASLTAAEAKIARVEQLVRFESRANDYAYRTAWNLAFGQVRAALAAGSGVTPECPE